MVFSIFLACAVVALITIHVLFILRRNKAVSQTNGGPPPGPAGHPLLGNLFYFYGQIRHKPHSGLASLAQTYGPVLSLRLGLSTIVVVSSPAAAHEALAKNDAALAARLVPDSVRTLSYSATSMVFLPCSNALWKQGRAIIGSRFASARGFDTIRPIMEHHSHKLTEHLKACFGKPVIIREVVNGTVLNVISNVLFSKDVVDLQGPQTFKSLIAPVLEEWSKSNVADAFPLLAPLDHLLGSRRRISIHLAKLFRFFDEVIITERLGNAAGGKHDDVLDVLLGRLAQSKLTRQQITTFLTVRVVSSISFL